MIIENPAAKSRPLGIGNTQSSHTGNTNETVVGTVTIPAGTMGPNGILVISSEWSNNSSGNNKTFRARLGGISGTTYFLAIVTTTLSYSDVKRSIYNRNATNSQIGRVSSSVGGNNASAVVTSSIDMSVDQTFVFTVQLANGADNAALEAFCVEVINP